MRIKDIAKIAGVSTSTVSKIINNKDAEISTETRKKVLTIVRRYHYTPYAQAFESLKTWRIGVILRSSISFDTTLDGIIQTAQSEGYSVLVFNSFSDPQQEIKNLNGLSRQNVDGVIWEPATPHSLNRDTGVLKDKIPCLTIGPYGGDSTFLLPYREAAYKLTQELINFGHTAIGCLLTEGRRTEDFVEGFKTCLNDNNMPYDTGKIFYSLNEKLLNDITNDKLSGFISSHYRKALEFYQLMSSLHRRPPYSASLVSIKNDTTEQLAYPGSTEISTYTIKNADFGSEICNKLIHAIEKRGDQDHSFIQDFHLDNNCTISTPTQHLPPKITVVGSINVDTYMAVPNLPEKGAVIKTDIESATYPGGKALNQAVGVAKLGQRVTLIGNVGSDTNADYIYQSLNQFGIDISGIGRCHNVETGRAFVFVAPEGESTISILSGANEHLSPSDIHSRRSKFANSAYCLIQSEVPIDTVAAACEIASEYGAKTILKPSSCDHLPHSIAKQVDILVPSEKELHTLVPGKGSLSLKAQSLLQSGIKTIIVTRAEKGCLLIQPELCRSFKASKQFVSIDSTGACDAFISALASYLLDGLTLSEAIEYANYAAAFSTTREGVIPSLIDKFVLESRMKEKMITERNGLNVN